jgi:hypothetical protein
MIFNWEFYKDKNVDLQHLKNEEEVCEHFNKYGILEERIYVDIPILFNWELYVKLNSDLKKDIKDEYSAWKHYLYNGKKENRSILNIQILQLYCI